MDKNERHIKWKLSYYLILFLFFSCIGFSQTPSKKALTKEDFEKLHDKQFTTLVSGSPDGNKGNFASMDIVNSSVTFSPSVFLKNGTLLGATFTGGITDGLSSVFNNSKLNSNVSLELQYHTKTLEVQPSITYRNEVVAYNAELQNIEKEFEPKFSKLEKKAFERAQQTAILTKKQEIENLETKSKDSTLSQAERKLIILKLETSNQEFVTLRDAAVEAKQIDSVLEDQKFFLRQQKARKIRDIKMKYQIEVITGLNLSWFSFSYKVANNAFRVFDASLAFDDQISRTDYTSHHIGFRHNIYKYSSKGKPVTFLLINGINFSITDNFNELSKVEVTDTQSEGSNNTVRSTTGTLIAYSGNYKKDIKSVALFSELYYFVFNNKSALHLFPEFNAGSSIKPTYNLSIGILNSFKKKGGESAAINAELFYTFQDLFGTRSNADDLGLFERNNIGLRFTLPIAFLN